MSHQIPYESLGIDLHKFVSSKDSLICLSLSSRLINFRVNKHSNPLQLMKLFTLGYFRHLSSKKLSKVTNEVNKLGPAGQVDVIYGGNTPLFNNLISILTSTPINKNTQLKLEKYLLNQGLEMSKLTNQNQVPAKLVELFLVIKPKLEKLIENYKKRIVASAGNDLKYQIIMNTPKDFIIALILGRILQIISYNNIINNKTKTLEVTIGMATEVIRNQIFIAFNIYKKDKNNKLNFYNWKQVNDNWCSSLYDNNLTIQVGQIILNMMLDLNLVTHKVIVLGRENKQSILVVGGEIALLLPNLNSSTIIEVLPSKLPMVHKPKLFRLVKGDYLAFGGYLLNGTEFTDKIILSNWELSSETRLLDKNDICDMVNKISSVPFKINDQVLDFIQLNNEKYNFYTDSKIIHPLSLKPKLSMKQEKELQAFNSKRNLELNILGLATIFRDVPALFIPVRLDYRGRLYCMPEYLNYQSIDLAKGLLTFSQGESVSLSDSQSISYLKIFGANCYGHKLDKLSFNTRCE